MCQRQCDHDDPAAPGHQFQPHPPQPIRESPVATRSSLARAHEPASGDLVRRAPPYSVWIRKRVIVLLLVHR